MGRHKDLFVLRLPKSSLLSFLACSTCLLLIWSGRPLSLVSPCLSLGAQFQISPGKLSSLQTTHFCKCVSECVCIIPFV